MTIDIEIGSIPLSGFLHDCENSTHRFLGWMEFASVFQSAVDGANANHLRLASNVDPDPTDEVLKGGK